MKNLLTVRAHPSSRKAKVEKIGPRDFRIHMVAHPKKGEANREVLALLADHLGLPVSRLRIVRGEKSRLKLIALEPDDGPTGTKE